MLITDHLHALLTLRRLDSRRSAVHRRNVGFFSWAAVVFCGRSIPNPDFLGTQSEFPGLQVTTVANDEVQEDDTGLFAFDPIRRIDEWREAMLADPNHTRKFSKEDAIPIAEQFLSARGSIVSLKEPMSRLCSDQDVCENRCRYWTYSDWRKFPKEGGMKTAVHQRVRYGETEQHGVELCKEWINK